MTMSLGLLIFCTGCAKELVCTKGGEASSSEVKMSFDENNKLTSINVVEKTDVSKLGTKEEEIDDKYLKEYRKKYADNSDYENIIVSSDKTTIIVSYDIVLGSKSAPKDYTNAKDKYKYEKFTCK